MRILPTVLSDQFQWPILIDRKALRSRTSEYFAFRVELYIYDLRRGSIRERVAGKVHGSSAGDIRYIYIIFYKPEVLATLEKYRTNPQVNSNRA